MERTATCVNGLLKTDANETYRITQVKLVTYSGRIVPIELEFKVFTEPLIKVKDKILDAFIKMCKESKDPFVRIECRTKPLIKV